MVELAKKVYLFIFVAFKCRKLFFHNGAGGHFGFPPLEKNAGIFARDTGAKYFLKGSRKSNQSSKHLSQKVVHGSELVTMHPPPLCILIRSFLGMLLAMLRRITNFEARYGP